MISEAEPFMPAFFKGVLNASKISNISSSANSFLFLCHPSSFTIKNETEMLDYLLTFFFPFSQDDPKGNP